MISVVEKLDPTVEEVKALIAQITETPMNQSMLVLKQKNMLEEAQYSGISQKVTKQDLDIEERRILRPMYVLATSEDSNIPVKALDMVRASRLTELAGKQIPCSIEGYKIILVRDYDVLTVIKS
jgi:hypothetical protein